MSFPRTYRPQPKWRPRKQFANAKPRVGRGNRKGVSSCVHSRVKNKKLRCKKRNGKRVAAAGQSSGRLLNRLPEWTDPRSKITRDGRHRLKGEDYQRFRQQLHERAGGICEGGCGRFAILNSNYWENTGDASHHEHGAKKSDEMHRADWKNRMCHRYEHDTGKKECAPHKALKLETLGLLGVELAREYTLMEILGK